MSMCTSSHLRALLISNNPCGQQFSKSRLRVFDAYMGTYSDLCNTIFFFRKLQAPPSVLVCGATCSMHVFDGFVYKFFGHFSPAICYGAPPRGSRNIHKMSPIYSSSIWHKAFDPPPRAPATIWRNPQQQNQWPAHCSNLGPHPRHSSSKCGWRHENDFIVMGNVHKMAHDVRETIVNPHIREKLRQRRSIEH